MDKITIANCKYCDAKTIYANSKVCNNCNNIYDKVEDILSNPGSIKIIADQVDDIPVQLNELETLIVRYSKNHFGNIGIATLLSKWAKISENYYTESKLFNIILSVCPGILKPIEYNYALNSTIFECERNEINGELDLDTLYDELGSSLLCQIACVEGSRFRFSELPEEINELFVECESFDVREQ